MFASKKRVTDIGADVFDVLLEFSTLGEYGLEYPQTDRVGDGLPGTCSADGRSSGARVRRPRRPGSPPRDRSTLAPETRLPEALRPPRLRLACLGEQL